MEIYLSSIMKLGCFMAVSLQGRDKTVKYCYFLFPDRMYHYINQSDDVTKSQRPVHSLVRGSNGAFSGIIWKSSWHLDCSFTHLITWKKKKTVKSGEPSSLLLQIVCLCSTTRQQWVHHWKRGSAQEPRREIEGNEGSKQPKERLVDLYRWTMRIQSTFD